MGKQFREGVPEANKSELGSERCPSEEWDLCILTEETAWAKILGWAMNGEKSTQLELKELGESGLRGGWKSRQEPSLAGSCGLQQEFWFLS